ncbi:MAG: DNA polymerase III subunit gamma/tau [Bacteroidales bacterium]|nr:DNA polymerase III subunit gamma/tau [Bacteroidales bacterium]
MNNYIVSARKYRPSTFKTIVGQDSITTTLKNAVRSNQVAQAFLFCGPRGVGKTTCARVLAKTINCLNITEEGEACNQCESCLAFNQSTSFNFFELDAASNNSVDDIRALVDQVRIPPQGVKYKVYIIDEVHMLSPAAFNAFLKTLEEPPSYVKFILATTEKHKILPTILSRCQIFDFKRIKTNDIVSHLKYVASQENILFEESALEIIGQKADGSLRDALSIFDQSVNFSDGNITYEHIIENLNLIDFNYFFQMMKAINEGDIAQILTQYNTIIEKGFDGQRFIENISEHIRNLMTCKLGVTNLLETGENITQLYIEQAKQLDTNFMLECLDIFNRCDVTYKSANNKRLHVELALMMCAKKKSTTSKTPTDETATTHTVAKTSTHTPQPSKILEKVEEKQTFTRKSNIEAPQKQTTEIKSYLTEQTPTNNPQTTDTKDTENTVSAFKRNTNQLTNIKQTRDIKSFLSNTEQEESKETQKENQTTNTYTQTIETQPIVLEEGETEIETCNTAIDPFELLTQNWKSYVEKATTNAIAARSLLNEQTPVIKENKLIVEVANTIGEKEIKNVIGSLIQIIEAEIGIKYDYDIHVNPHIKTTPKIIDPDEKYKVMLDENPNLQVFKQNLNLSIY